MQNQGKNKIKVLMTAGHAATTALSLFEEIKKESKGWEVVWLGTKKAIEGRDMTTLEHKIFSNLGIKSYFITSGRLQRKLTLYTIPSLLKLPIGFFESFGILTKEKPDVVVSFGGHVSFPVTFCAFVLGIPVLVHEQTAAAGLANKMEAVFARKVGISRSTSFDYFPKNKTVLVGNLVRADIAAITPKKIIGKPPIIYVTGGSRGSQIINELIDKSLETLLKNYFVIHHTGEIDIDHFSKRKAELSESLSKNYIVQKSFDTRQVVDIFRKADIVVSRGGANTVSEIIVTRKPSIIIPISWVQNNEQEKNARIAQSIGLSKVILEKDLNPELFLSEVDYLKNNWQTISSKSSKEIENLDKNASRRTVELIEDVLK